MKTCYACNRSLPETEFGIRRVNKSGLNNRCKECCRQHCREHYATHREQIRASAAIHRPKHRERNRIKTAEWYLANHDRALKAQKEYAKRNRHIITAKKRERRKNDPYYRLVTNLRSRVKGVLDGAIKSAPTLKLLGADIASVRRHLESKFLPGMSWENYGFHGWHVDHIRPCASFDLRDQEQQKQCFHYTNLQPLWAADNIRKHAKWAA
jgi:hypothetical protein